MNLYEASRHEEVVSSKDRYNFSGLKPLELRPAAMNRRANISSADYRRLRWKENAEECAGRTER